ncbi:MAG: nickel-dependent hydrogenase large subunit [Myxococcota bacterium]|nr:nickel-dependent hydrogenase large subunit [Myxococcota bacterium]
MEENNNRETLDISPVGRVEGDLDVRVEIEDGQVVNAWTQAEMFRGFEVILRGKDPQAGLVVTPRACGICGASHLTCASWALDVAYGSTVPRNAIIARNLGQLVETIQSIPRYFYGLFAIDMAHPKYKASKYFEEVTRRFQAFTGTSYEAGVTISGKPVEIYALLGGQWPHSSFMVPGGVMCSPTLTDVTRAWAILEYFRRNWLEPLWLGCSLERYEEIQTYDDFMAWMNENEKQANSDLALYWKAGLDYGLDKYGRGCEQFVTWGYLPHEDHYNKPTIASRAGAVIMRGGLYDGKGNRHIPMDQALVRENTKHAWYKEGNEDVHPFDRTVEPVQKNDHDFGGMYTWSTAVSAHNFGRAEAGPLARQLVAGSPGALPHQHTDGFIESAYKAMGGANLHLRQLARLHEIVKLYRQAERCLRELRLDEPFYIKPEVKDGKGFGATEAARGALSHWIEVKDGKIKNYQIIAPTTWNVGPRDAEGVRGPIEEALIGTPIQDKHDPVEVGHVARSFDSCLVCTVHAYDKKTGKQLAKFRTN